MLDERDMIHAYDSDFFGLLVSSYRRTVGAGWDEIVSLPSRLSAEPVDREERQKLLDDVARQGFATGYSGLRIAKSGRRFWIEDGVVWQLIDEDSAVRGQAATFAKWRDA
jgi:MEKHLA domain